MDTVRLISASPLFEMLSDEELQAVAALATERAVAAGEAVFEEGQAGDGVYVLASGEVEVLRRDTRGQLQHLATLGPPQFFGEMSLVEKEYRSATVRAREACVLVHLSAESLTVFRRRHGDGFTFIILNIARMLAARLRETNARLGGW